MSQGRVPRAVWMFLGWVVALVGVDQLVKWASREAANWVEGRIFWPIWPGVFELKLVWNYGVAFGLAQGAGRFLTPIAAVISGYALWLVWTKPETPRLARLALSFLTAGAIGNLIDRVWKGKVTDMFWIRLIDFPVFNVADVCITVAGVLIIYLGLTDGLGVKKEGVVDGEGSGETSTERRE